MARFLPEYQEVDTREGWEKIAMTVTWVFLILLVPSTALGYFAEQSIPGQTLYPVKRVIETVVLTMESVSPYAKSDYLQSIAAKRVEETNSLVQEAASSGDFNSIAENSDTSLSDIVISVQESEVTIQKISNPVEKQQAQQKLATSIQKYQTQLKQISYVLAQNGASESPTPTPTPTTFATNESPTPTVVPTISPDNSSSASDIQNQINQTQDQLQNITDTLQADSTTPLLSPPPTLTLTPTIPEPTNTPVPTLSPSPFRNERHNRHGDGE